ncbi:MAG TPA: chromate resistance protein ChrB domain-containing protein, partial [Gemmatimonadaceae bacterium]|nr:chromate resistance protein ChrB domain-containing protein [Gemmatimonadaceae bacterium]
MGAPWLLLIHQIPPKPDYFRVKVGRRLQRIGAVAIKSSVYVLPAAPQSVEDFQWLRREIVDGGGEASVCRAEFVDGLTDGEIERLFHEARARDFAAIAVEARATLEALPRGRALTPEQRAAAEDALSKLRKRHAAAARIDFFGAPNRGDATEALDAIEARLRPPAEEPEAGARTAGRDWPRGRTWVTREGIFVDRIASAWLIRRFIDPAARFRFVTPQGHRPQAGELRFDMFQAEYTHEGDRCTFETLLRRFDLADPALAEIAQVVHDIDLKDGKFGREDAAGIERVLAGIAASSPDDAT